MTIDPQLYDQLAKRLDRQDHSLDTILECVQATKTSHVEHVATDKSNFKWITWVLGGVWAAIALIAGVLVKG